MRNIMCVAFNLLRYTYNEQYVFSHMIGLINRAISSFIVGEKVPGVEIPPHTATTIHTHNYTTTTLPHYPLPHNHNHTTTTTYPLPAPAPFTLTTACLYDRLSRPPPPVVFKTFQNMSKASIFWCLASASWPAAVLARSGSAGLRDGWRPRGWPMRGGWSGTLTSGGSARFRTPGAATSTSILDHDWTPTIPKHASQSAACRPTRTRAVRCALLGAHACWMLIGACDTVVWGPSLSIFYCIAFSGSGWGSSGCCSTPPGLPTSETQSRSSGTQVRADYEIAGPVETTTAASVELSAGPGTGLVFGHSIKLKNNL